MTTTTVMVIDDDEALRESVCELLEEEGFRALCVDSGESALRVLRRGPDKPNLILLDLMMPGMNGWQFREEQLRDPALAPIPVVVMTANRNPRGIEAREVVYKPLKLAKLLDIVRRHAAVPQTAAEKPREAPLPAAASPGRLFTDPSIFAGGGEMGARMRAFDWSKTALGSADVWPQSLRSALSICLGSRFPIALYWGPELTLLYNDMWSPIPGNKHPWALGRPAHEVWPEIWSSIGPLFEKVSSTGEATYSEDALLPMHRHGYTEECYFNFTFSPVRGEAGRIEGVFNAVLETTFRVVSERRTRVLRELGERIAQARSGEEASVLAIGCLAAATHDVPFCGLYLKEDANVARLAEAAGLARGGPAMPERLALNGDDGAWPLARAQASEQIEVVTELAQRFGFELPGGVWPEPAHSAFVAPLLVGGTVGGFLVLGANPRRAIDDEYRQFVERAASLVSSVLTNAHAYEAERKRAEALAEIDRAKTTFFSNVSHEFRTPLTLMLGPTRDLLSGRHGQLAEDQRRELELLQRNGVRLEKLVNALLEFSRLEAGRVRAAYAPIDLSALTRELASAFEAAVERAGLRLVVDCPAFDEPAFVDRDMWEKIVLNLLSNALKFTFDGEIEIALRRSDRSFALRVRDTGVGVPADELPRLFERFHRIEGTRARTHEGSGIGLALVQELAKLHGGSVTATSELGRGTTFTVEIPRGAEHLPKDRLTLPPPPAGAASSAAPFVEEALRWLPAIEPRATVTPLETESSHAAADVPAQARILLADDNADMREYVRRHLEREWIVEAVEDGAKALAAARATRPDLILTDVMMPELDGFELLRRLRSDERTREIPVVMLSARSGEEAKLEGLQAGAEDYLTKPFSARELTARVRTHLEIARLRRAVVAERDRLRSLLGQAPAIINFLRGRDLIIEYIHPAAHQLLGGRTAVGRPLLEAVPEFRDQEFPMLLRRVLDTGERIEGRERLVRYTAPNGELQDSYWNFVYLPVRDAEGVIEGVMTFDLEVTEQVLARRRLGDSEEKYRRLVAQVGAGIAQTDLSGRFTFTNDRYREIVGRSDDELRQLRMLDITHPDDLASHLEKFTRLTEHGTPFVVEKRDVKPDGSIVWVQNSVSRIDDRESRPVGLAVVTVDITQRKLVEQALRESETRFRLMADHAPVMVWVAEADGRCTYLNKSWCEFTGNALEQGLGFGWLDAVHPEDRQKTHDIFVAANQKHEAFRLEYRLRRRDGVYRWVIDSAAPRFGPNREFVGYIGSVIDLTERKHIEDELRESEARFRNMADNSPVMVWVSDPEQGVIYRNETWRNLTGQSLEEALGFGWLDAVHPVDRRHTRELFAAANASREAFRMEYRFRRKDGVYRHALDAAAPRFGPGGEFLGYVGSVIDIDERQVLEDRLAALQTLTARLVDASDAEHVADVAIAGSAAIVGASAGVFYRWFEPGGPALLVAQKGLTIPMRKELALDTPLPLAVALRSGKPVWLESRAALLAEYSYLEHVEAAANVHAVAALPMLVEGGIIGGFALSFDEARVLSGPEREFLEAVAALCAQALLRIRALEYEREAREATKRSEARYREIFEGAEVSLWEQDLSAVRNLVRELHAAHGERLREHLDGQPELVRHALGLVRVLDVNPATVRLLGAKSKDELLLSLHRLVLPETLPMFVDELIAIAEGHRVMTAETVLRRLSGERIDAALTIGFPTEEAGWNRVHVTLIDISVQKEVARERESRVAEMERAVRFSELFVGVLGHDLRNPLSAITTAAYLLKMRADSDKIAMPASRIAVSADRMERMISQLLDFTRIRLGRGIPLHREQVDLREVARSIIDELEPVYRREIQLLDLGDIRGMWDRDRLSQLLSNLAGNACQHGTPHSPVLLRLDGSRGDVVRLEIENRGVIPVELLPVVFEPLRHSSDRRAKRDGSSGLGLGLYITQQIVLAHGGTITVESGDGEGTRFVVELPRLPSMETDRAFSQADGRFLS